MSAVCLHFWKKVTAVCWHFWKVTAVCWHFLKSDSWLLTFLKNDSCLFTICKLDTGHVPKPDPIHILPFPRSRKYFKKSIVFMKNAKMVCKRLIAQKWLTLKGHLSLVVIMMKCQVANNASKPASALPGGLSFLLLQTKVWFCDGHLCRICNSDVCRSSELNSMWWCKKMERSKPNEKINKRASLWICEHCKKILKLHFSY